MHFTADGEESSRASVDGTLGQSLLTGYTPGTVKLTTASGSTRFKVRSICFAYLGQPIGQTFVLMIVVDPSDLVVLLSDCVIVNLVSELSRKFEEWKMTLSRVSQRPFRIGLTR